jgi:hypothetical protein
VSITESLEARTWLAQFDADDQQNAAALLDAIAEVSADDLASGLKERILAQLKTGSAPIALYAERELQKRAGRPHRLFKEEARKIKRAYGAGPPPVRPLRAYDPDVGSEAIIAHLISEICRQYSKDFVSHAGPDEIRKRKVRRFIVVSDFVGSGNRAWMYLESAWRVRSVRSWHSLKMFDFGVIAYAATDEGSKRVKGHSCSPSLEIVRPCPTIRTEFTFERAEAIRELCIRYDPIDHDPVQSLGFNGLGALIAFAHGIPNNAPRMLYKQRKVGSRRPWTPLFPARITADLRRSFADEPDNAEILARLARLNQYRLSVSPMLERANSETARVLLVLAALMRGPRFDEAVARKTGLTIPETSRLITHLRSCGWIDDDRIPTDAGHAQLRHARDWRDRIVEPPHESIELYYPQHLRAPKRSSS